jgi:HSP20 family molecular chaperone IbpA
MQIFSVEDREELRKMLKDAGFTADFIHHRYPFTADFIHHRYPDSYPDTNPYPHFPDTNPMPERKWPWPGTASPAPKSPPVVKPETQTRKDFNCVLLQSGESYTLKAYLAGVAKDSISITLCDNSLLIYAESSKAQNSESRLLDEQPKSFSRTMDIPKDADYSAISPATYVDGVLELVIPRKIAAKVSIPVA